MRYVRASNNTVVEIGEIRRLHPNVSIPDGADCTALGFTPLVETPKPQALPWHEVVEGAPFGSTQMWVQQPMSSADIERTLVEALDRHFDTVAHRKRYYSRYTCAARAGYVGPFQSEGLAFAQWMDSCNAIGYQIMADVVAQTRPIPTVDELLAAMPAAPW